MEYLRLLVSRISFEKKNLNFYRILNCLIIIFSFVFLDRKKDLVKLQAGEYVSLGKVEAELKTCSVVENICVYGDPSKQFTVALVVPNPKHLKELAIKQGVPDAEFEQLCSSPVMEKAVIKELAEHARKCTYEIDTFQKIYK